MHACMQIINACPIRQWQAESGKNLIVNFRSCFKSTGTTSLGPCDRSWKWSRQQASSSTTAIVSHLIIMICMVLVLIGYSNLFLIDVYSIISVTRGSSGVSVKYRLAQMVLAEAPYKCRGPVYKQAIRNGSNGMYLTWRRSLVGFSESFDKFHLSLLMYVLALPQGFRCSEIRWTDAGKRQHEGIPLRNSIMANIDTYIGPHISQTNGSRMFVITILQIGRDRSAYKETKWWKSDTSDLTFPLLWIDIRCPSGYL